MPSFTFVSCTEEDEFSVLSGDEDKCNNWLYTQVKKKGQNWGGTHYYLFYLATELEKEMESKLLLLLLNVTGEAETAD